MGTVRFSVIIPTLNEAKYLPNLLASLAPQLTSDTEVIVVDGSSHDNTVRIARSFVKTIPHLQIVETKTANTSYQRNRGASQARGDWLIFADADVVLLPYFFDRIEYYISTKKPRLFTTWFRPDSDVPEDAVFNLIANIFIEGSIILNRPLAPGGMMIVARDAFEMVGGFDETIRFGEDYDMTERLKKHGVALSILRETVQVFSSRRIRSEGKLKFIQTYAKAVLLTLILNKRFFRNMPGYITGGHAYGAAKGPKRESTLRKYEKKLRLVVRDLYRLILTS